MVYLTKKYSANTAQEDMKNVHSMLRNKLMGTNVHVHSSGFLGLSEQIATNSVARNVFSHSWGGGKSEKKVSAGLCPVPREIIFASCCLVSWPYAFLGW